MTPSTLLAILKAADSPPKERTKKYISDSKEMTKTVQWSGVNGVLLSRSGGREVRGQTAMVE